MATALSVALVTGGASGIGRGAARELAHHYDRIVVADLSHEAAETVCAEIAAAGGSAEPVRVDVRDDYSVEVMISRIADAYGQIDVLVHSAGVLGPRRSVLEMTEGEWRRLLDVNLTGTFYVTRAVGRHMVKQGAGTMVLIASDSGVYGARNKAHYAASKAGIIAYMKSLALELGEFGVTCNAINPGTTETPGFKEDAPLEVQFERAKSDPLGRISTPEDIAKIILFLAREGGKFITGQLITTRMRVV